MLKFQTHPLFLKKIVPRPQEIHNGGYFLRENGIYHQKNVLKMHKTPISCKTFVFRQTCTVKPFVA